MCYTEKEVIEMRDMPFFTTLSGVASLTLSQIPYTGKAYIRIQDSTEPEQFLREVRLRRWVTRF